MVSLEGLTKVVDPSQLTADFDGSLEYNHEEWIEVRVACPSVGNFQIQFFAKCSEQKHCNKNKTEALAVCICKHSHILSFSAPYSDVSLFLFRCVWLLRSSLVTPPRCCPD